MSDFLGPVSSTEIREDILTDTLLESAKAGITEAVAPGSDNWVWATGHASVLMMAHARIDGTKSAITPLHATGDDLIRHRDARGLPEVTKSSAAGNIVLTVTGSATVPDGLVFTYPNGLRGKVVGTQVGVADGAEVPAIAIDTGTATNLGPGEKVRFLNPPLNVAAEAKVSSFTPLTGGYDDETEPRLRARILNRDQNVPGGGNWGQLRELAFNASPAVQQCYVYPAVAGPASSKTVLLKAFDRERFDFSREFPSAATAQVRDAVHKVVSTGTANAVVSVADEEADVAIKVDIPDSTQAGGNGEGWTDLVVWPPLTGGETKITVTAINTAGVVTVNATTATSPIAGQTRVAWWSPHDMAFHTRTIITVGGSAGAWQLTPDSPFVDKAGEIPAVGDYVSPAAEHLEEYGASWVSLMEELGSGENTNDPDLIARGRALRHPSQSSGGRMGLTMHQLSKLKERHSEIIDVEYSYRSTSTPTVPTSVDDPPNVLVPRRLGIYVL